MLDPVILIVIQVSFMLLFFTAAMHKLGNRLEFKAILEAYEVLPASLVPITVATIPIIEAVLAAGWLLAAASVWQSVFIPALTVLLLSIYTAAIFINLKRGRRHIDCGCGFRPAAGANFSDNNVQQLSYYLVVRNCLFILAALAATVSSSNRQIGLMDMFSIALATVTLLLLYGALNQLLVNKNAIDSWRKSHA